MCCGLFCGNHDRFGIGRGGKTRDIFRNRAIKQLHALREVSDMLAQDIRLVIIKRCTVQTDFPAGGAPNSRDRTGKRGFTCP